MFRKCIECALLGAAALLTFACDSDDPAPAPELTLQLSVTAIEATSATVGVVPSDNKTPYWFGVLTEEQFTAAGRDVATHVAALLAAAQKEQPEAPLSQLVAALCRTGTASQPFTGLAPETNYHAAAVGLSDRGIATGKPAVREFTTLAEPRPAPVFAIEVTDIDRTAANLSVTPDDNTTPYYFDVVTAEVYEECGGDLSVIMAELLAFLTEQNPGRTIEELTAAIQSRGPASDTIDRLPPSTDFYAFAIELSDNGECPSEASVERFRTLDPGDPAECTFEIGVESNDSQSSLITVTPSDQTVAYFTAVVSVAEFPGDANLAAQVQQAIRQVAQEREWTVPQTVDAICWRGTSTELQDGLAPSTRYYAYAFALTEEGAAAGPMFKETFTTLGENTSSATCPLVCDDYFDGDALAALDPAAYGHLAGKVYVPVKAQPSEDAAHWYAVLARGDLSDPMLYPDETTINALIQGGSADKTDMNFVADWGEATLLSVAVDGVYQFGTVFRKLLTLSPENAAPVERFQPTAAQSAPQLSSILREVGRPAPTPARALERRSTTAAAPTFRHPR